MSRITGGGSGQSWPMGGSNGGGRVTLGNFASSGYVGTMVETGFSLLVWDGGTRLFSRLYQARMQPGQPMEELGPNAGWKILQGAYQGPVGCHRGASAGLPVCAQGAGTGVRLFSDPWSSAALTGTLPPTFAVTQPTPGPIGVTPPEILLTPSHYVVVVRGQNGTIHQARRPRGGGSFGPWISEGGSAREGSGISCTAVNEQPICFIQGADGRIYRKALSTASGL